MNDQSGAEDTPYPPPAGRDRQGLSGRALALLAALVALAAVPVLLVGALSAGVPIPLLSARYPAAARVFERAPLRDIGVCICHADEEVSIEREDGLVLSAGLYRPDMESDQAIVVVHGNTPEGRRAPLFRVLAEELREQGYLVLSLDLAGYGRSADPLTLGSVGALDKQLDLDAAIRYLETRVEPRPSGIHLVGHSRGGAPAMESAARHESVGTVVAIGPSRRTWERLDNPDDLRMFWRREVQRRRSLYGRDMPDWYDASAFVELRRSEVLETLLPVYSEPGHPPVLFIDAEWEPPEDLEFLETYADQVAPPVRLVRVAETDHYKNTASALRLQIYDQRTVGTVVEAITEWIGTHGGDG